MQRQIQDERRAPRVTERGWATIRQVNAAVNREITPVTDQELFGRDEVWSYPDRTPATARTSFSKSASV